jgi:hypothetical protein
MEVQLEDKEGRYRVGCPTRVATWEFTREKKTIPTVISLRDIGLPQDWTRGRELVRRKERWRRQATGMEGIGS